MIFTGPRNTCRFCKWAEWQYTAHAKPRINERLAGQCAYPVERIALPRSIKPNLHKSYIWADQIEPCRVWESKS